MKSTELTRYKKLLLDKHAEIMHGSLYSESRDDQPRQQAVLQHATHPADLSSDTMEHELNSYLNARNRKFLMHLDDALRRIENGIYSYCLACGKKIQKARLDIVSHTRFCVSCKDNQTWI